LAGCYLDPRHVDLLRAKPRRRRTQAYWKVVHSAGRPSTMLEISEDEFANASPDVEVIDNHVMRPCPVAQARADEIVAAWDSWIDECNRTADATALSAVEDAFEDACDEVRRCIDLITAAPAMTMEGLRVKRGSSPIETTATFPIGRARVRPILVRCARSSGTC
jgi:hypothetical protein